MQLNDVLNFKTGSKFIITETVPSSFKPYLRRAHSFFRGNAQALPKGLVITIVNVNLNNVSQTIRFKVIRSQRIIKEVYEPNGVPSKFYTPVNYYDKNVENEYVTFLLRGAELVEFLNTVKASPFNQEYNSITNEYSIN
jgi:hypothetical protein